MSSQSTLQNLPLPQSFPSQLERNSPAPHCSDLHHPWLLSSITPNPSANLNICIFKMYPEPFLRTSTATLLVQSTITAHLDYCNSLLAPYLVLTSFQSIFNTEGRRNLLNTVRSCHSLLLKTRLWFPIPFTINDKSLKQPTSLVWLVPHSWSPLYLWPHLLSVLPFILAQTHWLFGVPRTCQTGFCLGAFVLDVLCLNAQVPYTCMACSLTILRSSAKCLHL